MPSAENIAESRIVTAHKVKSLSFVHSNRWAFSWDQSSDWGHQPYL